jgi:predicted O-methyltransferase YrrM
MQNTSCNPPKALKQIEVEASMLGFRMSCTHEFGTLLRTLAASKPGGCIVEIGTGVGAGSSWLLDGMDANARLTSVEINPAVLSIARRCLPDERLHLIEGDASTFLKEIADESIDLIFVDFRPGKFFQRSDAIRALKVGGLYIVDDLLAQPTWPEGHQARVDTFLQSVHTEPQLVVTYLEWNSGIILATKISPK